MRSKYACMSAGSFLPMPHIILDSLEGVKYNLSMKQKAPTSVRSTDQGPDCTAEAVQVVNTIIRLLAVTLKEIHSDVPQLPDRSGKSREAERRIAALEMSAVR